MEPERGKKYSSWRLLNVDCICSCHDVAIYNSNHSVIKEKDLSARGLCRTVVDTGMFGVCFGWRLVCLLAQVLHLQNKQVIVVSTTVVSLPPSALSALRSLPCLRLYSSPD